MSRITPAIANRTSLRIIGQWASGLLSVVYIYTNKPEVVNDRPYYSIQARYVNTDEYITASYTGVPRWCAVIYMQCPNHTYVLYVLHLRCVSWNWETHTNEIDIDEGRLSLQWRNCLLWQMDFPLFCVTYDTLYSSWLLLEELFKRSHLNDKGLTWISFGESYICGYGSSRDWLIRLRYIFGESEWESIAPINHFGIRRVILTQVHTWPDLFYLAALRLDPGRWRLSFMYTCTISHAYYTSWTYTILF